MGEKRSKAELAVVEETNVQEGGCVELDAVGIGAEMVKVLREKVGIDHWFEMQASVVRCLLEMETGGLDGDVIISAATGSGKTLAYATPIVEILRHRAVKRLRALVVTPTRDLAKQVKTVFDILCRKFGLSTAISVGGSGGGGSGGLSMRAETEALARHEPDILIATPGRLVHHTKANPDFTLSHLQFLVLDESDRLLQQNYHGWVDVVMPVAGQRTSNRGRVVRSESGDLVDIYVGKGQQAMIFEPLGNVRKILASATQTRNPRRVAPLKLRRIHRFVASSRRAEEGGNAASRPAKKAKYVTPATLSESAVVIRRKGVKPATLFKLLGIGINHKDNTTGDTDTSIVFTKSVSSAHKLARLLELGVSATRKALRVFEFSSSLAADRREAVLSALEQKNASTVVVCSDAMARGIDAATVNRVLNYDVPAHVKTYLHRVGRTARAGKEGTTVSILLPEQVRFFKDIIKTSHDGEKKVATKQLDPAELEPVADYVQQCLSGLSDVLRREELGLIEPSQPMALHICREILLAHPKQTSANHPAIDPSDDMMEGNDGDPQRSTPSSIVPVTGIFVEDFRDESGEVTVHQLLRARIVSNFTRADAHAS